MTVIAVGGERDGALFQDGTVSFGVRVSRRGTGPLTTAGSLRGHRAAAADAEGHFRVTATAATGILARSQQRHFTAQHHGVEFVDIRRRDDAANVSENQELVLRVAEVEESRY